MKNMIYFEYAILVSARFDHCPIYIRWDGLETPKLKPFRFENFYPDHIYFQAHIQQWW